MTTGEPGKSNPVAPNTTTGSAEVSTAVPDSVEKPAEMAEANKPGTSVPESGVAPAPGPAVVSDSPPAVESTKFEPKEQAKNEPKAATSPLQALWVDAQNHNHKEIWGVTLADPETHCPSQIIFHKYLNANDGDLTKAKAQLKATLDWREKTKPTDLIEKKYSSDKFAGLGYITSYVGDSSLPGGKEIFTWNIYGGVKDIEKSFGDLDAFIQWRVALMEMAMKELDLSSATVPITADNDPYKIYQVHDYKGTSFFRSPPAVRGAARKTVEVLAMAYPETLKEKFFVNVPAVMGFMYGIMKLFVAPKTAKKFHPMSNGAGLVHEFGDSQVAGLGEKLPQAYGGKGEKLSTAGKQPLLE